MAGALGAAGWAGWSWTGRRPDGTRGPGQHGLARGDGAPGPGPGAAVGDLRLDQGAGRGARPASSLEPGCRSRSAARSRPAGRRRARARSGRGRRGRAEPDRLLLDKLVDIRSARTDDPDGSHRPTRITPGPSGRPGSTSTRCRRPRRAPGSRPGPRGGRGLVAALDDWAAVRRSRRRGSARLPLRLAAAANAADPDPWRVGLRRALDLADRHVAAERAARLAASTKPETAPAVDLDLLGTALSRSGGVEGGRGRASAGRRRFPDDVWLNYDLAHLLETLAVAARSDPLLLHRPCPRPETAHDWPMPWTPRGSRRGDRGLPARRSGSARSRRSPVTTWAIALEAQGTLDGGHREFREAIRLKPDDAEAHTTSASP